MCDEKERQDREQMPDSEVPVVLVVEDELDVAETYCLWLEDDYNVIMAHDGDEALEQLDPSVDVVLLDRMMPGLSGDQVLEQIRDRDLGCRVAMVTAVEPDFDILEMGFDAYLSKPVKSAQLEDTVENLLERSEYDELLQEYYSLVETQATLESTKTRSELADSDEYAVLQAEIDALRDQLSETLGEIEDDEDFIATIRNLSDLDRH
jgi:DNA-binding response OmpR family regulator